MNRAVVAAALIALACVASVSAQDDEHVARIGAITILHPWARAADVGSNGLVFMEIDNGGVEDRLIGARTDVASSVHIVGLTLSGDMISTQEIGPITIVPGEMMLDPGGLAFELRDLSVPLAEGEHFDLVMMFELAGDVAVEVEIEPAGATQHRHAGHSH